MSSYAAPLPAMIQRPSSNVTASRPAPPQGHPGQADQQQMMMLLLALLAGAQGGTVTPPPQPALMPPGVPLL